MFDIVGRRMTVVECIGVHRSVFECIRLEI